MTTSIFFDLDGTISDPREGIVRCLQYALERLGYEAPPEQQLVRYIGPPLYESLAALLNSTDAGLIKRAVESYRERFAAAGMFENSLYRGIPDVLEKLRNSMLLLRNSRSLLDRLSVTLDWTVFSTTFTAASSMEREPIRLN